MPSLRQTVVALLVEAVGIGDTADACVKDHQLASTILELLGDAEAGLLEMSMDEFLGLADEELDPCYTVPDEDDKEEDDQFLTPGRNHIRFGARIVEKKSVEEAVAYYRSAKKGHRSLAAMKANFRWIKTECHLRRLRDYQLKCENRRNKLNELKDSLKSWVLEKMEAGVAVHDCDLRHQALKMNKEMFHIDGFKSSHTFIQDFKKKNGICSRKVTKFVSKKNFADKEKLQDQCEKFVNDVKELVRKEKIPLGAVFNGDQSGFVKEQHGAQSLALIGQKSVFRVVDSVSATTHSCTVLLQVSADGKLREKVCFVLQEPKGLLPAKGHYQADNFVVYAHTSHIMTKSLMIKWLVSCVFTADLPPVSLLILDSWPAFRDHQEFQTHVPQGKKVFIRNIPAGCTSKVQPLDVFFFIHIKKFMKRISSHVQLQGVNFPVHQRDNLLKSISQVFWLFSHSRFADFLRYSWAAAGYIGRPGPFETPAEFAFSSSNAPDCEETGCDNITSIRCPATKVSVSIASLLTVTVVDSLYELNVSLFMSVYVFVGGGG